MIFLPHAVRIYVAVDPQNLRRSFEGLSNEVRTVLTLDPLSGHLFLLLNRRRTQIKMLVWTRGGFTIVHKKLERGSFARAFATAVDGMARSIEIDVHELSALLEGLTAPSRAGTNSLRTMKTRPSRHRDSAPTRGRVPSRGATESRPRIGSRRGRHFGRPNYNLRQAPNMAWQLTRRVECKAVEGPSHRSPGRFARIRSR